MNEAVGVHVRDRRSYFRGVKLDGWHLLNGKKARQVGMQQKSPKRSTCTEYKTPRFAEEQGFKTMSSAVDYSMPLTGVRADVSVRDTPASPRVHGVTTTSAACHVSTVRTKVYVSCCLRQDGRSILTECVDAEVLPAAVRVRNIGFRRPWMCRVALQPHVAAMHCKEKAITRFHSLQYMRRCFIRAPEV